MSNIGTIPEAERIDRARLRRQIVRRKAEVEKRRPIVVKCNITSERCSRGARD